MKNFRKPFLRALLIIVAILVVGFIALFTYVSLNKDKIIAQVTREIETKINGKLSVQKVELSFLRNFPSVSVLLNNVSLTDTMFSQHKHTFFKAKEVFVNLAVSRMIRQQSPLKGLRIDEGEIYIFTDTTGYTNAYLFSGKKDSSVKKSSAPSNSELKKIVLNKVNVIIDDLRRGKYHNMEVRDLKLKVDDEDEITYVNSKADILVKSLAFNTARGSFLKDKVLSGDFDLKFHKVSNRLMFDSIDIKLSGQPFNMTGNFQLSGIKPQFSLRLHSRKIKYETAKSLLPAQIAKSLAIVDLNKPLDVSATIYGPLKGGDPYVYAKWATKDAQLLTPFLDFDNASFTGFFTNEVVAGFPRKDPNSKIEINTFKASWHGLPVTTHRIEILNLSLPVLTADISTDFELARLNELIGTNSLKLQTGNGSVRLNYKGPIEKNSNTNSFLNGEINFKNGNILYASRDVELKNVNGKMVFRNSDIFVENLQAVVFGQSIVMEGQAKNLLTLINTEPDKVNIEWKVSSPSLNLEPFTFLFDARKKTTASAKSAKGMTAVASKIDNLLERGRLNVSLNVGNLLYKKFSANNVRGEITLLEDRYILNNVSMNHAGGQMGMNGSFLRVNGSNHQANLNVNMSNVDVSRMLRSFDNFGQDAISAENLEGKFSTKLKASMILDSKGKVVPSSISSIIDFSLKDGALNNYEPIKKVQQFVFKNRNFENIRFAELKNRIEVKGGEMKINRMEIQSSVLTMYVEGLYSKKGGTDVSIQVPLNNLKKRSADFNPENLGAEKKGWGSIYIRGRPGPDGNVKFKLDLFNKFDKQKEKDKIK